MALLSCWFIHEKVVLRLDWIFWEHVCSLC